MNILGNFCWLPNYNAVLKYSVIYIEYYTKFIFEMKMQYMVIWNKHQFRTRRMTVHWTMNLSFQWYKVFNRTRRLSTEIPGLYDLLFKYCWKAHEHRKMVLIPIVIEQVSLFHKSNLVHVLPHFTIMVIKVQKQIIMPWPERSAWGIN